MKRFCIVLGCICAFWIWFFFIDVSATDINGGISSGGGGSSGSRTEYGNVLSVYAETLEDYVSGEITIDDLLLKSNQIINECGDEIGNRLGLGLIQDISSKIERAVEKFGDNASLYISQWIDNFFDDYRQLADIESSDNPDKKGYGAMITTFYRPQEYITQKAYADYFVLNQYGAAFGYSESGYFIVENYDKNGNLTSTHQKDNGSSVSVTNDDYWLPSFYGDIRYEDGTQVPTDDEYVETEVLDFSNTSDTELEELLKNLLNKLNLEMPDLSAVEGLLEAIYYRLGTLDSDNDNELLSQVVLAIQALQSNDSELLLLLQEIRDNLENGGSGDSVNNTDFQEQILNYISDGDVSDFEEFAINVRGLFYSKFSFISEFQSFFSSLSWSSPELIVIDFSFMDNNYSIDTSVYNELMPTVRGMLAFFIYGTFCIRSFKRMPTIISGGGDE